MRTKSIFVVVSTLILAGCSSTPPVEVAQTLAVDIELWDGNYELTSNGNCKGTDGTNFENNSTVVLVGPDDAEISAGTFDVGKMVETTIDSTLVTNFPDGKICRFDVIFSNVPTPATYRIKTKDGEISSVSWSLDDVQQNNWEAGMVYGAEFTD